MENEMIRIVDLIEVLNDEVEKTEWFILDEDKKARIFSDLSSVSSIYQVYYTTDNGNPLKLLLNSLHDKEDQDLIFIGKIGIKYYYDEDSYEEREEFFITFASKVNGVIENNEKITYYRRALVDEKYIEGKELANLFKRVQIKVNDLDGKINKWLSKFKS